MALRAIIAFLMLPTIVAGVLPFAISFVPGPIAPRSIWGLLPIAVGAAILIAAVVSFHRRGRGTLAPWDPPRDLVVQDLYRFNRNPMYVGVVLIVIGWAVVVGAWGNWVYAALVPIVFHLRVTRYEEPEMQRLFGDAWERYRSAVPRWSIRLPPDRPETDDGRQGDTPTAGDDA